MNRFAKPTTSSGKLRLALAALVAFGVLAGLAIAREDDDGNTIHFTREHRQIGSRDFQIDTLSTRNDLISGGDVLVRIGVARNIPFADVRVTLDGRDVTGAFHDEAAGNHALVGLVTGLRVGENILEAREQRRAGPGGARAFLQLDNHPITGPVLSGPHLTPYECRTVQSNLGAPLDADCSATPRVDFFYRASNNSFKPLTDPTGPRPVDLVNTTTNDGATVPYIVRVESGTNNRTIFRIAMLDDPKPNVPFAPGAGWNRKLVVSFGGGCDAMYNQGVNQATNALSNNELSRGFAFAISTELVNNQHCNAALQGEAMMMLKEHFIETYGVPKWTLGLGGSGGAIQQYLITEMFPGLLDGLQPNISYPDSELVSVLECRLLLGFFATDPTTWTTAKQNAVIGYSPTTCQSWASNFANTNVATHGVGALPCGLLDQSLVYNPVTNPNGARCTVAEMRVNIYGRDPRTGFALGTEDNVGVQYGLGALNRGQISVGEFLALNDRVGGFDVDGNIVAPRTVASRKALVRSYRSGLVNQFHGGLSKVPILTQRVYLDLLAGNALNIHDRAEDFVIRARLARAQGGRFDNQIIWTAGLTGTNLGVLSLELMNRWLDAIAADPSPASLDKVARNKPADAVDACFDAQGNKIVEPQVFTGATRCNTLYPNHSQPRLEAGMPLTNDIKKCRLKPIDPNDYAVTFTADEMARLRAVFPDGVCDFTRRGVGQRPLAGTFLRFGVDDADDRDGDHDADDDRDDR
jgi:uncharacterized tannase-like protein DUF6351